MESGKLTAVFQPIVRLSSGEIIGQEGLIRGPLDGPLHSPDQLFSTAERFDLSFKLDYHCRRTVIESFAGQELPGCLFLNVSPKTLLHREARYGETILYLQKLGITPDRIIVELTENYLGYDYAVLKTALEHYRNMGFAIAIDDLGQGSSSLRLWSELRPEYVKIDKHFVNGIHLDPIKSQFVRSIQQIAEISKTTVIAEGIELAEEMAEIRTIGVDLGQGYFIARPSAKAINSIPTAWSHKISDKKHMYSCYADNIQRRSSPKCDLQCHLFGLPLKCDGSRAVTADLLMRDAPTVTSDTAISTVHEMFFHFHDLLVIPVVDDGLPVGIINRYTANEHFAQPFWSDLHGRKPCTLLMDRNAIVVETKDTIQEVSRRLVEADRRQLANGFIITESGCYRGVGNGQDLIAEITRLQIEAARHANPLTHLPGNIPTNQQIDSLLSAHHQFVACYCDINHFKPFNDAYGYRRGDDVIQWLGNLLIKHHDPERDFVGHIGGDDFVIVFLSADWERRCQNILSDFQDYQTGIGRFFRSEDTFRGGYYTESREGKSIFCQITSLAIGAVIAPPQLYKSHQSIAKVLAEAKKQAKKAGGNHLFIDRRIRQACCPGTTGTEARSACL
jgi:EAL domain-containing protein (putative c-di-GMP-specific phosphodiesterase class I)/GGDEF domain-containing protein